MQSAEDSHNGSAIEAAAANTPHTVTTTAAVNTEQNNFEREIYALYNKMNSSIITDSYQQQTTLDLDYLSAATKIAAASLQANLILTLRPTEIKKVVEQHHRSKVEESNSSSSSVNLKEEEVKRRGALNSGDTKIMRRDEKKECTCSNAREKSSTNERQQEMLDASTGTDVRHRVKKTNTPADLEVAHNTNSRTSINSRKDMVDVNNGSSSSSSCSNGSSSNNSCKRTRKRMAEGNDMIAHRGSCFCGAVTFEFRSRSHIKCLVNCSCELCLKYMDPCLYIKSDKFRILTGEDKLTTFTVSPIGIVTTHFCSICGVKCFRKIAQAPTKIANVLIAICGSQPVEDLVSDAPRLHAALSSPRPNQEVKSYIINSTERSNVAEVCDVIGIGNVDGLDQRPIKYAKIIKCDMTKVTWDEMKRLLFV